MWRSCRAHPSHPVSASRTPHPSIRGGQGRDYRAGTRWRGGRSARSLAGPEACRRTSLSKKGLHIATVQRATKTPTALIGSADRAGTIIQSYFTVGDEDPSGTPIKSYRRHVTSLDQTALAEELVTTMAALRRLLRRRLPSAEPGSSLRGAHVELLQVIKKQPGIGIAPAGRVLHLAANSVSTLVNQLVDIGMLVRQTAPEDRRAAQLWLTETATQRLAAWRQGRIDLVAGGVAGLSCADRQALTQAVPALRALLAALDTQQG